MERVRATTCPRCAGRLVAASDWVSRYLTCLMCGFVDEPTRVDAVRARLEAERDERMVFASSRP
jgi:hypothetical protein